MNISNFITKEDLGEPYDRLLDFLELEDIVKLESEYKGRQIIFKRNCSNIGEEYPELLVLLGYDKAKKVIRHLGDIRIYFPTLRKAARDKIFARIRKEFNGYNMLELGKRYGYTERNIRNILGKQARTNEEDKNQVTFDDFLKKL